MSAIFISFEGIDGAGKSTHIPRLAQALEGRGRTVTLTREPGGTPLAEKLRTMVLGDPMDAMTEALLVFAARRDHLVQVIEPALQSGHVVLCDRFTDATFAYQGGGRGFSWEILSTLEQWVQGRGATQVQPDLTLWFDLPADVAAQRLSGARVPDKFESQPRMFFEQVANAYARRCHNDPGRFARINADQPPDQVWVDILAILQHRDIL